MKGERPEILSHPEPSCLISTINNNKEKTKTHTRETDREGQSNCDNKQKQWHNVIYQPRQSLGNTKHGQ